MSQDHSNQFRDTPHYVPLTGEIRAGKIQGEARGYPDAQSGTIDWTGNPTTISSPREMSFDDHALRLMATPDGVRRHSNHPRHDSDGGDRLIETLSRYNSTYRKYANSATPINLSGGASRISERYNQSQIGGVGYSILDASYPPPAKGYFTSFNLTLFNSGLITYGYYGGGTSGYGQPQRIDSDCSMHFSRFHVDDSKRNQQDYQVGRDWASIKKAAEAETNPNFRNAYYGINSIKLQETINTQISTDSAVSGGYPEFLQLLHDRSKTGPYNNISANGTDFAEPPKLKDNRGIGEIRFSDFRGKSQIYKVESTVGDNHGYNNNGYYGYGRSSSHINVGSMNQDYFEVGFNGQFLSGGTNSAGTALNAYGFVHPDFGGKTSPTGITLPSSGGGMGIMSAYTTDKQYYASTDGNINFHQKHRASRTTAEGFGKISESDRDTKEPYVDIANYGRCTHIIWYTDTTFTTADFTGQTGQLSANASWPGGTYGTAVGNYIFEIGFSSRIRNCLISRVEWCNGTHPNSTSNSNFFFGTDQYGFGNANFYPQSNWAEVAYRGAHADNGYFGQTVWRGLYSCEINQYTGSPPDYATESRPIPNSTASLTATGNIARMRFFPRNLGSGSANNLWRESE